MAVKIVREWQAYITLGWTFTVPVESEGETPEEVKKWLRSTEGYEFIKGEFRPALRPNLRQGGIDMEIEDITLKETEVRGTDTDPRV